MSIVEKKKSFAGYVKTKITNWINWILPNKILFIGKNIYSWSNWSTVSLTSSIYYSHNWTGKKGIHKSILFHVMLNQFKKNNFRILLHHKNVYISLDHLYKILLQHKHHRQFIVRWHIFAFRWCFINKNI